MPKYRKKKQLVGNPAIAKKIEEAVEIAEDKKIEDPKMQDIQALLQTREIREILNDILDTSSMTEVQKDYVRRVFIKREPPRKAIRKVIPAIGREEDIVIKSMAEHPAVKDFIDVVKLFYVRIAPVAAVKELEMIMNPKTKDGVRMEAIKNVQEIAGVRQPEGNKNAVLPVNITINMPTQTNIKVEGGGE